MTSPELPLLPVTTTPESERHWRSLADGEFVVPWCTRCDQHVWPPRSHCTICMTTLTAECTLTGRGRIYSSTVVHRGAPGFADAVPYVLAYVTLEDGPTVLGNIVSDDVSLARIGAPVRLVASGGGAVGAARFEVLPQREERHSS